MLDTLSGIAQSAAKLAGDLRLLQHEGELLEPFESEQIGSSAMAYKRNPMRAERISGLARFVISLQANTANTAASQWLERTLDDSANRRIVLPEAFLATDAILVLATNIAAGLEVREPVIARHVAEQMPFMATERWLMLGVSAGGDRQGLHEVIRTAQPGGRGSGELRRRLTICCEALWRGSRHLRGSPPPRCQAELDPAQLHRPRRPAGGRVPRGIPPAFAQPGGCAGGDGRDRGGTGMTVVTASRLPLPLWRRGKVREVYEVDPARLLLVASDRVSAFDVVMAEPVPRKGAVLTQISAFWFERLATWSRSHFLTARHPRRSSARCRRSADTARRSRAAPCWCGARRRSAFECVIRGYISGSAWKEYRDRGTLAGEPLPPGLVESARFPDRRSSRRPPRRRPGTTINVTERHGRGAGCRLAARLRQASFALYQAGRDHAASRGIIIADTKFEFGTDAAGICA